MQTPTHVHRAHQRQSQTARCRVSLLKIIKPVREVGCHGDVRCWCWCCCNNERRSVDGQETAPKQRVRDARSVSQFALHPWDQAITCCCGDGCDTMDFFLLACCCCWIRWVACCLRGADCWAFVPGSCRWFYVNAWLTSALASYPQPASQKSSHSIWLHSMPLSQSPTHCVACRMPTYDLCNIKSS